MRQPPGFEMVLTEVARPSGDSAYVRGLALDGHEWGARASRRTYGNGYWPPAVGDVVRVLPNDVELTARPRGLR